MPNQVEKDTLAVQMAQARELPERVLLAECNRRGWTVKRAVHTRLWDGRLWLQCWPPLADDDEPLPFEVR